MARWRELGIATADAHCTARAPVHTVSLWSTLPSRPQIDRRHHSLGTKHQAIQTTGGSSRRVEGLGRMVENCALDAIDTLAKELHFEG